MGGGWYYSDMVKDGALVIDLAPPRVVAVGNGQVTLRATSQTGENKDWRRDGIYGLQWAGGYGQVGALLEISGHQVVREFFPIVGSPTIGDIVRFDQAAFPGDPQKAHDLPFTEVSFSSPFGDLPAWFVDGSRSTWAIVVHGRRANRRGALPILPTLAKLGLPSLMITYRNDAEVPASLDRLYRYGQTEWEDLEAAADYALQHGAKDLVLIGHSYGGTIVMSFLYHSTRAGKVRSAILDSPMLDFNATIDLAARRRGVPGALTALSKVIVAFRFGIDWKELNYLNRADELAVPFLLFHSDADDIVPVETSDALAEDRPDIVTYLRCTGAAHTGCWNRDPAAYESAVRDFLRDLIQ